MRSLLSVVALVGVGGVASATPPPKMDAKDVAAIKDAAAKYQKWGRVDDAPRVAPTNCAAVQLPSHVRLSDADGDSPHGKKLYFLWSSDKDAYLNLASRKTSDPLPVGFAIVKQSFSVKKLADKPSGVVLDKPTEWLDDHGTTLAIDKPKDLFVIVKVGERATADAGWLYGTVASDGTVTSAGRVASCMGCHDDSATHERLFGLRR